MKYRQKLSYIDAMQLGQSDVSAWKCVAFIGPGAKRIIDVLGGHSILIMLGKKDAQLRIDIGDFIVRTERGVLHRYSEKEFNTIYEPINHRDYIAGCEYREACRARWKVEEQKP